MASLMGMSFTEPATAITSNENISCPVFNVRRLPLGKDDRIDILTGRKFVPNFYFARFPFASYVRAHAFASDAYKAARGFALEDLYLCLYAISMAPILEMATCKTDTDRWARFHRYSQRAYLNLDIQQTPLREYVSNILETCRELIDKLLPCDAANLDLAVEYLTLSEEKQHRIALWSHGPRPLFILHGDCAVVDLHAVPAIFQTLFVGVRYTADERGYLFEEAFRRSIDSAGYQLLPNRILRALDNSERETDAAVRVGNVLMLFDCRSMERPLDYELGNPKTIDYRIAEFSEKIRKAHTIAEFVRANPVGTNYDFSWATEVKSAVVSPFVEWIWSLSEEHWLGQYPVVLSVSEALSFLSSFSKPRGTASSMSKRLRKRKRRKRRARRNRKK